jgi:hypothetical protein
MECSGSNRAHIQAKVFLGYLVRTIAELADAGLEA